MANITGWGRGTWGQGTWGEPIGVELTGLGITSGLGTITTQGDNNIAVTGLATTSGLGALTVTGVANVSANVSVTGLGTTSGLGSLSVMLLLTFLQQDGKHFWVRLCHCITQCCCRDYRSAIAASVAN